MCFLRFLYLWNNIYKTGCASICARLTHFYCRVSNDREFDPLPKRGTSRYRYNVLLVFIVATISILKLISSSYHTNTIVACKQYEILSLNIIYTYLPTYLHFVLLLVFSFTFDKTLNLKLFSTFLSIFFCYLLFFFLEFYPIAVF